MKREDEQFKQFFEKALSGVSELDAQEKTKSFFEIMTSEGVIDNFRNRYMKMAEIVERDGEEMLELSQDDVSFLLYYINILYTVYMSMIDQWTDVDKSD